MSKEALTGGKKIAVIILAGGNSERMGSPKLLLPFDQNHTFLHQLVETYRKLESLELFLVLNKKVWNLTKEYLTENFADVTVVLNSHPEYGRLYSINLALSKITTPYVFIQNTDNPFVKTSLLKEMLSVAPSEGYVSPRYAKQGGHPILLCGPTVERVAGLQNNAPLSDALSKEQRIDLPTDDLSILVNINSPESYSLYFPNMISNRFYKANKPEYAQQ